MSPQRPVRHSVKLNHKRTADAGRPPAGGLAAAAFAVRGIQEVFP